MRASGAFGGKQIYFNTNNLVKVRLILKEVCKNVPNI